MTRQLIKTFKYKCTLKCSMVIKSLTITEEAYDTLKRLKREDESFSKTIIRVGKTGTGNLTKYLGLLKDDERTTEEMIAEVKENRRKTIKEFDDKQKRLKRIGQW